MNKKQLIAATLVALLSVSTANATDITGVTGNNGIYNINPEQINGDVGYRYYNNFNLSSGDIANLIYEGTKNGEIRDLNTFINLVNNQVQIHGLLNALKSDGTGHAVFISPKGMVVGASGVLNVGTLSVVTPTQTNFDKMTTEYGSGNFTTINNISAMRNNTPTHNNNYGGNAAVDIQGKILARNGVDIRGSQVDISGTIVNGYNGVNLLSNKDQANAIFNQLVNTDGTIKAGAASYIANNDGRIVIKSGAGTGGINITGNIAGLNKAETAITNHGNAGLKVSGTVATNGKLNVYNNNAVSALTVSGKLTNKNADMSLTSEGGINVQSGADITTAGNLEIVNKKNALTFAGTAVSQGKTDIVNNGTNTTITGNVGDTNTTSVRIVNENGKLVFSGKANAKNSVSLRNSGAQGMEIGGTVNAGEGVLVHNKAGNAELSGNVTVTKGNIAVMNEGNGKLTTTATNRLNGNGNIAVKNEGLGGMELNGTIVNQNAYIGNKYGETAINNLAGTMDVNGSITTKGNMGIINRGTGAMTLAGQIDNTGKLKVANVNGEALNVNGTITNKNGNVSISNYNGDFEINGDVTNSDGYLFVYSRDNSNGLRTGVDSNISNTNGDLAIKHNGRGTNEMGRGLDLNGTITKAGTGDLAINNYNGDMNVGGTITTDSKTGIINRAGAGDMEVKANITSTTNKELRIKNEAGTGDITVGGTITHDGRLNILNNDGTLTLDGTVNNNGSDRTYAISKGQADGIDVTNNFNASSENGMIYILNKTGENGLNYNGTASSTNGQVELYNKAGNMTVTGNMNGKPAVILNTGDGLTVSDTANLQGDVKIVNKGSEKATVADKYKNNFRESLKK